MAPQYEVKAKNRIRKGLAKYTEVLQLAAQRGISEDDTVTIVRSMLVDLLGYNRFQDLTGQYAVKGRRADLAVKVKDTLMFFVEVKSLGKKLRERDLFQITSYSRQYDLEWTILTTGDVWQCHRVISGQEPEEFFEVRIPDPAQPDSEKIDYLYLLTKEASSRGALQERWARAETFRPERLAKVLVSENVLAALRRGLHRDHPGRRVDMGDLREALLRGVIRGDLSDMIAQQSKETAARKRPKRKRKAAPAEETSEEPIPEIPAEEIEGPNITMAAEE